MIGAPAIREDGVTMQTIVTLDDQVELDMRCMATPAMRAGRLRRSVVSVLVATACTPLALIAGGFVSWAQSGGTGSLRDDVAALLRDPPLVASSVLAMAFCTTVGIILQRLTMRPRLRRILRRIHLARPDVDQADPQLAYKATLAAGADGLESRTAAGSTSLPWKMLHRWEERRGLIIAIGDGATALGIRPSTSDPAAVDRYRSILTEHLGPPGSS